MDGHDKLLKEISRYEKLVSLCEKRIAKIEFLLSTNQPDDIQVELNKQHDMIIDEWYINYQILTRLKSILE
ncbi:MAG: hypothetical protein JWN78_982 [Bacteroidota bacterium]|nr:hypothetical protein [Bacteroidota bacterium]